MVYASPRKERFDHVGTSIWSLPKRNVSSGLKILPLQNGYRNPCPVQVPRSWEKLMQLKSSRDGWGPSNVYFLSPPSTTHNWKISGQSHFIGKFKHVYNKYKGSCRGSSPRVTVLRKSQASASAAVTATVLISHQVGALDTALTDSLRGPQSWAYKDLGSVLTYISNLGCQ